MTGSSTAAQSTTGANTGTATGTMTGSSTAAQSTTGANTGTATGTMTGSSTAAQSTTGANTGTQTGSQSSTGQATTGANTGTATGTQTGSQSSTGQATTGGNTGTATGTQTGSQSSTGQATTGGNTGTATGTQTGSQSSTGQATTGGNTGTATGTQTGSQSSTGQATTGGNTGTATGTMTGSSTAAQSTTGANTGTATGTQTGSQSSTGQATTGANTGTATGTQTGSQSSTGQATTGGNTGTATGTQTGSQSSTGQATTGANTGTATGTMTGSSTAAQSTTGANTGTATGTQTGSQSSTGQATTGANTGGATTGSNTGGATTGSNTGGATTGGATTGSNTGGGKEPEATLTDPCQCLNNATNSVNGQFLELIHINGPAGDTWQVIDVTGAYAVSSPNPPAAPTPLITGTILLETEPGVYELQFVHVDGMGYSITVSNGTDQLSISNLCYYPEPVINGLADTYCVEDAAVTLSGDAGFTAGSGTFTINGQPATVFDPGALGVGTYTVVFDFTSDGENCNQAVEQTVIVEDNCGGTGSGTPNISTGNGSPVDFGTSNGDLYIDLGTGTIYEWSGTNWNEIDENDLITELCIDKFPDNALLCVDLGEGQFIDYNQSESIFECNLMVAGSNCLLYTPFPSFEGTDVVIITVCDENEPDNCIEYAFIIHVGCVKPVANADYAAITENSVTINGQTTSTTNGYDGINIDVLANDSGSECNPITNMKIAEGPSGGTATVMNNGEIFYDPDTTFEGTDELTYIVCNDCGLCDTTTVTITVTAPCIPVLQFDICTEPITPVTICPNFCLGDDWEITKMTTTFSCSLQEADGCVIYTPLPMFYGNDVIEITACNPAGECETAYVNMVVKDDCDGVNEPPVGVDDKTQTEFGMPVSISVLDNDSDPDGDDLHIGGFTQPANGSVEMNEQGLFIYTPNEGFSGTDIFAYLLCDDAGNCVTVTVTIEVAEECIDDMTICAEPVQPLTLCPSFCELGGGPVIIQSATTTYNCSLKLLGEGCIEYRALPLFAGQETIAITGCNTAGECQTVYITVNVTDDCDEFTPPQDGKTEAESGSLEEQTEETGLSFTGIAPVPAVDFVNVQFSSNAQDVDITLFDISGKMLSKQAMTVPAGLTNVNLQIDDYPAGVYIVQINSATENISAKIIKQ